MNYSSLIITRNIAIKKKSPICQSLVVLRLREIMFYNKQNGYIKLNVKFMEWIGMLPLKTTDKSHYYILRLVFYYLSNLLILLGSFSNGLYCLLRLNEMEKEPFILYFFCVTIQQLSFFFTINYHLDLFRKTIEPTIDWYFREYVEKEPHKQWVIKHTKFFQRLSYIHFFHNLIVVIIMDMKNLTSLQKERPLPLPFDFFEKDNIPILCYYLLLIVSSFVVMSMANYEHGTVLTSLAIIM